MKHLSPVEAAALVRPDDSIAVPLGPGQPAALLHAMSERDDFDGLRVFGALMLDLYPLFAKPGVTLLTGFLGPAERALQAAGHDVQFVPGDFRRFANILERLAPRVVSTSVAPPDSQGRYSLSLHAGATIDGLRSCAADPNRVLIAEVNPGLPRTYGLGEEHPHCLHEADIDILIESDRPVPTLEDPEPSEIEREIAKHVQALVPDEATLQTGIGGVPSAVAGLLASGSGGGYGVHSEMFTTGLMHLQRAGKVSNASKGVYDGVSICTFALGTQELHEWLHESEEVRFLPVGIVNDPSLIARHRRMVTINSALSVDLVGQVVADTIEGRQHSGIGGHEDFVSGASLEGDDRSFLCMPSTARVKGRTLSRIQAVLPPRSIITTPRHQVDVIVTEYGAAELRGRTLTERAEALISIAHPGVRDALAAGESDVIVE